MKKKVLIIGGHLPSCCSLEAFKSGKRIIDEPQILDSNNPIQVTIASGEPFHRKEPYVLTAQAPMPEYFGDPNRRSKKRKKWHK